MNKILSNEKSNIYKSSEILNGKYLYVKKSNIDYDYHCIFTINDILLNTNHTITYKTKKCYIFAIPFNKDSKCYLYENNKEITINQSKDILFEMTFEEFVNTFREFVKYDGYNANSIPTKIIQDII